MADPRGFLNIEQQKLTPRPVHQRIKDYRELYHPMPAESVRAQASRCMDCGIPFCHTGCPLGNLIPDWNELVHRNRWEEAQRPGGPGCRAAASSGGPLGHRLRA
jgi:glutamate synthase (NADPH) small chain